MIEAYHRMVSDFGEIRDDWKKQLSVDGCGWWWWCKDKESPALANSSASGNPNGKYQK